MMQKEFYAPSLLSKYPGDLLAILRELGGYYERPPGGPLVGYAGRYGSENLQYVGEVYADFSKMEEHPILIKSFVENIYRLYHDSLLSSVDEFCGAPLGGMALATILSLEFMDRYVFPEKKIKQVATQGSR